MSCISCSAVSHGSPGPIFAMGKRARVAAPAIKSCLNLKGISRETLRNVIDRLDVAELNISTRHLKREGQARFAEVQHTCLLPAADGDGTVEWHLCHPLRTLDLLLKESDVVQGWYLDALGRHPCAAGSPWRLLIGWDEFVPGNKLALESSRKTMCLSFTFAELGLDLNVDTAWITPVMVRTSLINRVRGGWSRMLRELLHLLLLDGGSGLQAAGHPVTLRGSTHLLFARVELMLGDGDGLRLALQWLGANAVKPCFKHWNVLKRGSALLAHDPRGVYVDIAEPEPSRFLSWSTAELCIAADACTACRHRWEAGEIPKARVAEAERALGYRVTPDGLLADKVLRRHIDFCNVVHYDWVHTLLEDGAITREAWALLHACDSLGLPGTTPFRDLLAGSWCVPKGVVADQTRRRECKDLKQLARLFEGAHREKQDAKEAIKCAASDWFLLYGMLRYWVVVKVPDDPRIRELRSCVLHGLDCIAVIIAAKRGRMSRGDAAARLVVSLQRHLAAHVQALGPESVRPKMHWAFDFAEYLGSCRSFMDCLIIERLHLRVRNVAQHCKRLDVYEKAVCAGVLNAHCNAASARDAGAGYGLQGPTSPMPSLEHLRIADRLYVNGIAVAVADMVCRSSARGSPAPTVGRVLACCFDGEVYGLVVDRLPAAPGTSSAESMFAATGGSVEVWLLTETEPCIAWTQSGDTVLVILP